MVAGLAMVRIMPEFGPCPNVVAMSEVGDIGVVGAGFMGSGIAESAARAGCRGCGSSSPTQAALDRSQRAL